MVFSINSAESDKNIRSCILLCGGMSRRMGKDKGSLIISEKPMIIHVLETLNHRIDELVIVLNDSDRIAKYRNIIQTFISGSVSYSIKFVEDEIKDKGPISGIATGLKYIRSNYALIIPCDSPYIDNTFISEMFNKNKSFQEQLNNIEAIVPYYKSLSTEKNKTDYSEPLHAIYKKNSLYLINKLIDKNILDLKSLLKELNTYFIDIEDNFNKDTFKNLNKVEDLSED